MSGQLKEVRTRIKSVQSTQQITKAMKMVSAAKLRKAQDAIQQLKPYANKLKDVFSNIASSLDGDSTITLATQRAIQKVAIVVITSDKGLCGGYNANIIKLSNALIAEKYASLDKKTQIDIVALGKKGYEAFKKNGYTVLDTYKDIFLKLNYDDVKACRKFLTQSFVSQQYDAIEIVFSEFKNAASQLILSETFLPIESGKLQSVPTAKNKDYLYEPNRDVLLEELIPLILNTQLLKAILDAAASEHGARMTAMDKATENANEILKKLKISYNRARQAAITTELSEIVSGAIALES